MVSRGRADGGGVVRCSRSAAWPGSGKTTFSVHAAHRLAPRFPDGQFFVPLHGHTPGIGVDPADALASLLLSAGVSGAQIPPGLDARAARWRGYAAGKKTLLVLDDAAGHEQVRPLLPGTPGSLVLITSRKRLGALDDAAVVSLHTLPPGEAAGLLICLASRAGLIAAIPVAQIAALCGYLPLAIGMLAPPAGNITRPGLPRAWPRTWLRPDTGWSSCAPRPVRGRRVQPVLPGPHRRAAAAVPPHGTAPRPRHRCPAAAALDDTGLATAHRRLEVLYSQHLITEPARGRYRLHDLVREHARALVAADDPWRSQAASGRLLDYYLHTALAASSTSPPGCLAPDALPPAGRPPRAPPVSTPRQAVAWLEAERANLHAAAGYAAATPALGTPSPSPPR